MYELSLVFAILTTIQMIQNPVSENNHVFKASRKLSDYFKCLDFSNVRDTRVVISLKKISEADELLVVQARCILNSIRGVLFQRVFLTKKISIHRFGSK